jgi:hypothetical protein
VLSVSLRDCVGEEPAWLILGSVLGDELVSGQDFSQAITHGSLEASFLALRPFPTDEGIFPAASAVLAPIGVRLADSLSCKATFYFAGA